MKKFKSIFFLLIFIFVSPLFAFACDEVTFDDVPYEATSKTAEEIISDVDNTRSLMINSIELKVELTTTNTYTFKNMENYSLSNKVVKDVIKTTIGKNSDNPAVAIVESTRYVDDIKTIYEKVYYVHSTIQGGAESKYAYYELLSFDQSGNVIFSQYDRVSYSKVGITFMSLYNNVVPVISASQLDNVKYKSFEGVNYYNMSSDINGLYYVNDKFSEDQNLYYNPKMFSVIDGGQDYVKPFSCEFGLKSAEGYNYITYSTINYSVENAFREVYLTVSSHSELNSYGDKVATSQPEDKDKYTANSFINLAQQDEFYITYEIDKGASGKHEVSIAKFNERLSTGEDVVSYSAEVIEKKPGETDVKNLYYMQGSVSGTYATYQLDVSNPENLTAQLLKGNTIDFFKFNFDVGYHSKADGVYRFALSATTGTPNEYTGVLLTNGEVSKIIYKNGTDQTDLIVLDYGNEPESLGLIQSLDGFTLIKGLSRNAFSVKE